MFKKKKSPKQLTELLVNALRDVSAVKTSEWKEDGPLPALSSTTTAANLSAEDNAALEVVAKRLSEVRFMMCGDTDNQPKKDDSATLAQLLPAKGVPLTLIQNLGVFPFEARTDACHVLSYMIQSDLSGFATRYLRALSRTVVRLLVELFADPGIALLCGALLRDCLKHDFLAAEFLESSFWVYNRFFDKYLVCESFELCSDAFATFRLSLTKHGSQAATFLVDNYDKFFAHYNKLLVCDQYVTQRQSLKLLSDILLDWMYFAVMMAYISDKENLKTIMNVMRVKSPAIQMDAYHVFKVFVANPKKSEPVAQILARNRDKIINYLQNLNVDRDDDQFTEERNILIGTLSKLQPPTAAQAPAAQAPAGQAPAAQAPAAQAPAAQAPAAQAPAAQAPAAQAPEAPTPVAQAPEASSPTQPVDQAAQATPPVESKETVEHPGSSFVAVPNTSTAAATPSSVAPADTTPPTQVPEKQGE